MAANTLQARDLLKVCQLVAGQCHLVHHGLDRFVLSLVQAPQTHAMHDLEQKRREILLN